MARQRRLLLVIILAMISLTLASQLEIFALGVIMKKGPDFFELFAPEKNGRLVPTDAVSLEQVETRWKEIDRRNSHVIRKKDAERFLVKAKKDDPVGGWMAQFDARFGLTDNLTHLAFFLVVVALFKAVALFLHRFSTRIAAIRVSSELRQRYFDHIQKLPMTFYQQNNIGTLAARVVGDASLIADAVNACLTNFFQTPFVVVTTLTLCFLTSWQLSLMIFLGFPLLFFPIVFLAKRVKRLSKQIHQNQERFASVLIDFIAGIQTVKMFGMEAFSTAKYHEQNQHMAHLEKRSARYDLSTRPIVHTIAMTFLAIAIIYGLYVLQMNVAEILFYCGMLYLFYEPIKKFAEENTHIQRGLAAAERIQNILDLEPQIQDRADAIPLTSFNHDITFDDVWFRYGEEWVLRGLSLTVKKGETVALVGPTGAGKSTVVQLLPRLYDIEKGFIHIDGKPLEAYSQASLREQIAVVPQKPFLFLDTVAANIAYGRSYSMEKVQEAARLAHADEFVRKLPSGYDTVLAEAGKDLSGGQQQRLAIARALFKEAPILILDEATSSLDAVSESYIQQAIQEQRGARTQIIVAHRLSTIEDADRIIYIEQGVKIAEGTKDELLDRCEGFRTMWNLFHK